MVTSAHAPTPMGFLTLRYRRPRRDRAATTGMILKPSSARVPKGMAPGPEPGFSPKKGTYPMNLYASALKATSIAVIPLVLTTTGAQASAGPTNESGSSQSAPSTSGRSSQDLTDASQSSAHGSASNTEALSVIRTASGQTAVVDRSLADQGITAAAGTNFVDLSWQGYSNRARYLVTRDSREVATLAPGVTAFHDTRVTPGSTYRYSITPATQPQATDPRARAWGMKVAIPSAAENQDTTTALRSQAAARTAAAKAAKTTTLTWVTFIPQDRIDAPPAGCDYGKGYQFGGDNRSGFDWRKSDYRTSLNAVINWSDKSVQGYKEVRASHVYQKSTGKLIATRTATDKEMSAKKLGSGKDYVDVRMVTHASNPFCKGLGPIKGGIDGAFTMHLTTSGNYSITSGTLRLMPNHYIYVYNGGKVTNVYTSKYGNLMCLIGSATCEVAQLGSLYGKF